VHDFKWELRRIVASDRAERVADVPLGLAIERVDVSEPASISMGIAKRYASAIFDLAIEGKSLPKLESDVSALAGALEVSADLRDLISSPVYTRDEQGAAISAVAQKMELTPVMANSLALMASKRRLFVVPQLMAALRAMIAEHKGETTAEAPPPRR
jgi:F-type H+-transporting ATPase subunit delta